MIWKNIRDEQPQDGEEIVQVDPPYEGHCSMRMRKYYQYCTWGQFLESCEKLDLCIPDFCWISAKDFPFPKFPEVS